MQLRYDLKTVYSNFPIALDSNMELVKSRAQIVLRHAVDSRSIIKIKVWACDTVDGDSGLAV